MRPCESRPGLLDETVGCGVERPCPPVPCWPGSACRHMHPAGAGAHRSPWFPGTFQNRRRARTRRGDAMVVIGLWGSSAALLLLHSVRHRALEHWPTRAHMGMHAAQSRVHVGYHYRPMQVPSACPITLQVCWNSALYARLPALLHCTSSIFAGGSFWVPHLPIPSFRCSSGRLFCLLAPVCSGCLLALQRRLLRALTSLSAADAAILLLAASSPGPLCFSIRSTCCSRAIARCRPRSQLASWDAPAADSILVPRAFRNTCHAPAYV